MCILCAIALFVCFFLVVYCDWICWRYFTHTLCNLLQQKLFRFTVFFSCVCIFLAWLRFRALHISSSFFRFHFFLLTTTNVFSRYAMQLRLLYTKPKTNPNRQCLIHSTHFVHPSSLNSVKLHDLLNLWIIHLKQIRNEISFFLSLSISRCWLDGYFFYLNSIAKNRLKTNRNSILGGKKPRKMISIHCSLQRPHICLILVNLRLHA